MVKKILCAHINNPDKFQHVLNVEVVNGNDESNFVEEIVDLMNDDGLRDCIFKVG